MAYTPSVRSILTRRAFEAILISQLRLLRLERFS
jgi:hypothetical protein